MTSDMKEVTNSLSYKLAMQKSIDINLELNVHDDMYLLFNMTNMPIAFYGLGAECYIMQQDRFVFVGRKVCAAIFIMNQRGNLCKDFFSGVKVTS